MILILTINRVQLCHYIFSVWLKGAVYWVGNLMLHSAHAAIEAPFGLFSFQVPFDLLSKHNFIVKKLPSVALSYWI